MPFTALAAAGEYSPDVQLQFGTFIDANGASTLNDFENLNDTSGILMSALYLTALDYSNGSLTLKKDKAATVIDEIGYDELDSDYTYKVGDYFTTTVRLDNIDKLAAAEIALSYSDNIIPAGVAQKDDELVYYTADEEVSDVEIEAGAPLDKNGADTFYAGVDDGIVGTLSYVDDEQNIIFVSTTAQDGNDYVDVSSVNDDTAEDLVDPETGEFGCKYENKAILATFAFKIVDEGPITFSMAKPNSISGSSYDGAFYIADASEGTSPADYTTYEEKDATGSTKMTFMGKNEYVASSTVTVKFQKEDGTAISSKEYEIGSTIDVPDLPTKASDKDYHYTYAWNTTPATTATEDVTYTAVETKTAHNYGEPVIVKEPTETQTGLKRYTCTDCDYSYDEEMAVTEHVHTWGEWVYNGNAVYTSAKDNKNGTKTRKCETCNEVEEVDVEGTNVFRATSVSLTLASSITVNFKIKKTAVAGFENPYIVVSRYSAFTGQTVDTVIDEYTDDGTYYSFAFSNLAPNNMGDALKVVAYGTVDGLLCYGAPLNYGGVATYAYSQLNKITSKTNFATLLVDLLNYGATAQTYQSYDTDNLVNAKLTEEQSSWGTTGDLTLENIWLKEYEALDNPEVNVNGITLVLNEKVTVRYRFNVSDMSQYTVKVQVEGESAPHYYTMEENPECFVASGSNYYFYFNDLNADKMRTPIYVQVLDKEGKVVSPTSRYSVESYAAGRTGDLKTLTDAMMRYGDSAAAYGANPNA
jgi:hypothetical protein